MENKHNEINSKQALKLINKHKGKLFILMQNSEYFLPVEKNYFINEILKNDINNGLWAKWDYSEYKGCAYIDRCIY